MLLKEGLVFVTIVLTAVQEGSCNSPRLPILGRLHLFSHGYPDLLN